MVASKQSTMTDRRALLTDREREIIAGDIEALEAHGELGGELRDIVCKND